MWLIACIFFHYREKEDDVKRLNDQNKHQAQQAEQALDEFKNQMERNSNRMFENMKQQVKSRFFAETINLPTFFIAGVMYFDH